MEGDRAESSRFQLVRDLAERERPTSRQLLHRLAGARGHKLVAGTPEQVADVIETWFTRGAADGFNIMPPYLTGGFTDFAEQVVPILRRPRPVPSRVHRHHPARALRPGAAGVPVRPDGAGVLV